MPTSKKPYRGPEPDTAAFKTQQEFLDSLTPVPLESLEENNRRCPYCWRTYGEPTPGHDDAEAPVRFICNHVFGEQCMRSLFGIREPVRHDLVPLSFAPGSKGADLGSRLSAYIESDGTEKSALLSGGSREKFVQLLTTLQDFFDQGDYGRCQMYGDPILGAHWYRICQQVSRIRFPIGKIHLLENAVIVDVDPSKEEPPSPYFDPSVLYFNPSDSLSNDFNPNDFNPNDFNPNDYAGVMPSNGPGPWANPPGFQVIFSGISLPVMGQYPPLSSPSQPTDAQTQTQSQFFTSWEQEAQKMEEKEKHLPSLSGTWKEIAPEQSNLDKLLALQKEKKGQLQASMQKEMETKKAQLQASQAEPTKDTLQAKNAFLKKQAMQKAYFAKLDADIKKKQSKLFIEHFSKVLVDVYEAYERHHHNGAVAASRLPAVKKLKLAENAKVAPLEEALPTSHVGLPEPPLEVLHTTVHKKNCNAKGAEVAQPYSAIYMTSDDEDEQDGGDNVSETAHVLDPLLGSTIVLKRQICRNCFPCPSMPTGFDSPPEYVYWHNTRNITDNCPKCRRVLFNQKDV